jgi:hypothetical protein
MWLLSLLLLLPIPARSTFDPTCSLETVRQPWDTVEQPWVLYADQNCPSETGLVDDAAIWHALVDLDAVSARNDTDPLDYFSHRQNKSFGGLARPAGLIVAGGDLMWVEQDAGLLRSCPMTPGAGKCLTPPRTLVAELNCPQDFKIDFSNGHIYVLQFGGGGGPDASLSCGGDGRITRFDLGAASDNSSRPLDVVPALVSPRFLALDPLYDAGGGSRGLLFWTDAGNATVPGYVMRAGLDGRQVTRLFHLSEPSGIAADVSRQALYVTQRVAGASLVWSSYDGAWQRHISSHSLYKPRGLAIDPTDGSVAIVEFDTYARGCDPLAQGGYGAISCGQRNLGRISRVSCAWTADTTTDGRPPAPFECCCEQPPPNPWGCTLECPPPGPPPPSLPPPLPPVMPSGTLNYTDAPVPPTVRNYARTIVEGDTIVFVGGYVTTGTTSISWGDPTTVALVTAARVAPPPPPGQWPVKTSGELFYGNCTPGCGRPIGIDDCAPCAAGSYGTGDGLCRRCAPGSFGSDARQAHESGACTSCPRGSFAPSFGSKLCQLCPAGAFCADGFTLSEHHLLISRPPVGGIPLPVLCPVGTYNPNNSSTSPSDCLACPAGTYRALPGGVSRDQCLECAPGSSSPSQSSYCGLCRPSTAQPLAGAPTCDECPAGTFSNTTGALSCSLCPLGSHGPTPGGADHECLPCNPGSFSDTPGAAQCTPCADGTASAAVRATSEATCRTCPGGFYALDEGSTHCTPCPNITITVQAGVTTVSVLSASGNTPQLVVSICAQMALENAGTRRGDRGVMAVLTAVSISVFAAVMTMHAGRGGAVSGV